MTIQEWLEQHNMTARQLAEQMQMSEAAISLVMTGKREPSKGFRWSFAQAFGWDAAAQVFDQEQAA
jgi:transcriptional regulator with XRE-family HTH domain